MASQPAPAGTGGADERPQDDDATLTQTLDLVRRGQAGDRDALELLFVRYYDVIRRVAVLRTGAALRQREDVDDIVQAALLDTFRALENVQYRSHREFVAWLAKITVNRIRALGNHHGAKKRGADADQVFLDRMRSTLSGHGLQVAADQSGPSTKAARRDEFEHVMECARQLSDQDRELLALFMIHGEDWTTIGAELGLANDAARMRWARVRARLASLSLDRRRGG